LPDGNYLTPVGGSVTVKGGQIVINANGNPLSNSPVKQTNPANTNPTTGNQSNPLMNPYQGLPLLPGVQQRSNINTPTMSVQPGINTIYSPPPNPNTPTMNQVGPTAPSQEPGAPGL